MTVQQAISRPAGAFKDPVDALASPEVQELAQLAVTRFRARSIEYDPACKMPEANIRELFERGWLTATVSRELGGMGSNLLTDDPATYLSGENQALFPFGPASGQPHSTSLAHRLSGTAMPSVSARS